MSEPKTDAFPLGYTPSCHNRSLISVLGQDKWTWHTKLLRNHPPHVIFSPMKTKARQYCSRRNSSEEDLLRERIKPLLYSGDPDIVRQALSIYTSFGYKTPEKLLPLNKSDLESSALRAGVPYKTLFLSAFDGDFSYCNFNGQYISLHDFEVQFRGCDFTGGSLRNHFNRLNSKKCFDGSSLVNTDINFTNFPGSSFDMCIIERRRESGNFQKSDGCSFVGARFLTCGPGHTFSECDMRRAVFGGVTGFSRVYYSKFLLCDLRESRWLTLQVEKSEFAASNLRDSTWSDVTIDDSTISESCPTDGVKISNVSVHGMDPERFSRGPKPIRSEPMAGLIVDQYERDPLFGRFLL